VKDKPLNYLTLSSDSCKRSFIKRFARLHDRVPIVMLHRKLVSHVCLHASDKIRSTGITKQNI